MPKKRQRLNEIGVEYNQDLDIKTKNEALTQLDDNKLFTVDVFGSTAARKKVSKAVHQETNLTLTDKKKLSKITRKQQEILKAIEPESAKPLFDIWDESILLDQPKKNLKKQIKLKKLPIEKINPGTSYNPAQSDHVKAISKALQLEEAKLKKEELSKQLQLKSNNGMPSKPAVTDGGIFDDFSVIRKNIIDDNEDDDDDEDNDEDDVDDDNSDGDEAAKEKRKLKAKLTRSERNRKRAQKEREFAESIARGEKKIIKSINMLPEIIKSIKHTDAELVQRKETRKKKIEEGLVAKHENSLMTYEDAGSVPLSDELNGSLRTIIPKGNRVKDLVNWKVDQGEVNKKVSRPRRAYEKPHGKKNIKWTSNIK